MPADASVPTDGVERLIGVLECHDRTLYFGLGALTNLATALAHRPDLAPRVELVQMGPALADLEPRLRPQYNARLDPESFVRVLAAVRSPSLLLSHVSWARFRSGRTRSDSTLTIRWAVRSPPGRTPSCVRSHGISTHGSRAASPARSSTIHSPC